ncbi:MAG TPA: tetratricopeptide repeat protein [Verrucomicrobiae bacterium]
MDSESSKQSTFIFDLLGWLETNKKRVLIGLGVAAVLGVIISLVAVSMTNREERASEELTKVGVPVNPTQPIAAGTADNLLKLSKEYSGTKAAARALLASASTLFLEGNYTAAQQRFEEYAKEYPDTPWIPQAAFGVAACLDAQKKTPEAISKYEEVRKRYANDNVADESKLALARLYEGQNRPEDAYKLYDELANANPYSALGSQAGMKREDLLEKYPQFAKTNAPAPTATTSMNPTTQPKITMITNRSATAISNALNAATNAAMRGMTNISIQVPPAANPANTPKATAPATPPKP